MYYAGLFDVANPGLKLKPSMTVKVTVQLARAANALQVPLTALVAPDDMDGNRGTVRVVDPKGRVRKRAVTTGLRTATAVQILSGLRAGENVVIGQAPSGGESNRPACLGCEHDRRTAGTAWRIAQLSLGCWRDCGAQDVSLRIDAGEFIAIIGPSGSGKSTLMNILGCLDRPTEGSYRVNGEATEQMAPDTLARLRREHFGFIFQRYNLMENLSATENVALPAVYAGMEAEARTARARRLLETLGLGERTANRPSQLSGGQQQRVSIARSLMNGGAIVLADEPTGALDHASGQQVMAELKRLHAQGHTVILVTHDAAIAANAKRLIEIADGRVVADRGERGPASASVVTAPDRGVPSVTERRARMDAIREATRMAVRSMLAHRLRTLLTMLGIIIGVAAVVTVVALGKGAQAQVESQINELGASTLEIFPGADFGDPRSAEIETLVVGDADHLGALSYVDSVSPNLTGSVAALQGSRRANTQVLGVGPTCCACVDCD